MGRREIYGAMWTQKVSPDFIDKDMSKVILALDVMKNLQVVLRRELLHGRVINPLFIHFNRSQFSDYGRALCQG